MKKEEGEGTMQKWQKFTQGSPKSLKIEQNNTEESNRTLASEKTNM